MPSRGYLNFEYKPISLNEWLAPAMMATQYQRELEDKYLQLQSEANAWDKIKANEQDAQLYENVYKPYVDAINAGAEELSSRGSNPNSRKKLYALTAQYNKYIKPIEEAYNKREQEQALVQKAKYNNPNLLVDREPNSYSLEDFISGNYRTPQMIDKDQLYKTAVTTFQPLAKAIRSNPEWTRLNNGYWSIRAAKGYTPQEIQQAIADPEKADPLLRSAVDSVINSSNAMNWSNPAEAIEAITPVVNQALTYAMGSVDTDYKADLDYQAELNRQNMAYKAGLDRANMRYQASLKPNKGDKDDSVTGRYPSADTQYPGRNQAYNKAWDTKGITYNAGEWTKDGKIIKDKDTKQLYDKYKKAYSYLTPEQAIEFGSAIDQRLSLRADNGALYTTGDASYGTTMSNVLRSLYADGHVNFYDREGKAIKSNDWASLIKSAKDNDYEDVVVAMDGNGLHIKVGEEWYDSMLPGDKSTAKNEIAKANYYVNNVYRKLSDFSDGGIRVNSPEEAYNILVHQSKPLEKTPTLRHIRFRLNDDNTIHNVIYDTSNDRIYESNSNDIILNGGDDFSDTMYNVYQVMLYDVMKSANGPSSK